MPLVEDILVEPALVVRIVVLLSEYPNEVEVPVRIKVLHCRQLLERIRRFLALLYCLVEIWLPFGGYWSFNLECSV